jgi:hypothetical protein
VRVQFEFFFLFCFYFQFLISILLQVLHKDPLLVQLDTSLVLIGECGFFNSHTGDLCGLNHCNEIFYFLIDTMSEISFSLFHFLHLIHQSLYGFQCIYMNSPRKKQKGVNGGKWLVNCKHGLYLFSQKIKNLFFQYAHHSNINDKLPR